MACAGAETSGQDNFQALRERMVETQIRPRNIQNAAVLDAMQAVPRHCSFLMTYVRSLTKIARFQSAAGRRSPNLTSLRI